MLQRPELFGAVVCQVPLLDMQRYHKLLAGASWMAEYGDPDKPERVGLHRAATARTRTCAPSSKLPRVLFTTRTRDDRVHPGHARKMAARMLEQGHDVLYYENIEGGHGGAADNAQRADMLALEFSFLWQQLSRRMSGEATVHNAAASRFEMRVQGQMCIAQYRLIDGVMWLTHTEVPSNCRAAATRRGW